MLVSSEFGDTPKSRRPKLSGPERSQPAQIPLAEQVLVKSSRRRGTDDSGDPARQLYKSRNRDSDSHLFSTEQFRRRLSGIFRARGYEG
jgi:hypothetical protein